MLPREVLPVDEIDLSDLEGFWTRPMEEREGAFATLRRERPVAHFDEGKIRYLRPGRGYWAVTRYEDVTFASRHPELFCSGHGATTIPDLPVELRRFYGGMINMDDPEHVALRRIVSRVFTPRRIRRHAALIQRHATALSRRLAEKLADGAECDFVREVAAPLPLRTVCDIMGVPASHYEFVLARTNKILGFSDPDFLPRRSMVIRALVDSGDDLRELMRELCQDPKSRAADGEDTVLSLLSAAGESKDGLSVDELTSFFILLLLAGNETSRNALSWALCLLTEHPDQRRAWQDDVEGITDTAVEEIVRWSSPVIQMRRTATQDTELAGQRISAGDKVLLFYNSANRDESVFTDPYSFDVRRDPNPHLGYGGFGPHYCLGAHLARLEVGAVFRELFTRLPGLRSSGPPERLRSNFLNGVKRLPCTAEASRHVTVPA